MKPHLTKTRSANGILTPTIIHESFEIYGETFHITESRDNEHHYTSTHAGTGLALQIEHYNIYTAKKMAIEFILKRGKKETLKVIRKAKWLAFKQDFQRKNYGKKAVQTLSFIWQIYCALMAIAFLVMAFYQVLTDNNVPIF